MTAAEQRDFLISLMRSHQTFRTTPRRPERRVAIETPGEHYYAKADKKCATCGYTYPARFDVLWVGATCAYCHEDGAR